MKYIFPKMEQKQKNTLFVIGNGFDIANGIKSRYSDFKNWLELSNNQQLINLMDIFFSNRRDVWVDIESALGEYDENGILDFCQPDEDFDYDHPTRSIAAIEDSPNWIFKPVLDDFIIAFHDWIDNIDIKKVKPIYTFPPQSTYLTFNYTETLEKIYGIPYKNILHIHGSRMLKQPYIIGHNRFKDPDDAYNDNGKMPFVQDTLYKIIDWMNHLEKDTKSIIRAHQDFFDKLYSIEQVIVYGHSFGTIDMPYMEEIIKHIGKDKSWLISYHSDKDLTNINYFIKRNHLEENVKLSEV